MSAQSNPPTGRYVRATGADSCITEVLATSGERQVPQHRLQFDGHRLPYIEVGDATERWLAEPPSTADGWADEAYRLQKAAVERGERIFDLHLDDRFGMTATESELERWVFFLANAMAVSAGFTSHGPNSRRINRHGVSRK